MAIDLEKLRETYQKLNKEPGKNKSNEEFLKTFLQVNEGTTVVRILPGDEEKQFYAETKIHRIPTSDGKTRNVQCRRVHNEQCPLCDLYYALWKIVNEGDENGAAEKAAAALARKIKPAERYYMNVVDRATNEVKIFSTGKIVMNKVITAILDPDIGDITDVQNGFDFKIIKTMVGEWPKYDQSAPRPKSTPLGSKADIAAFLEQKHDIWGLVRLEDYEEVKNLAQTLEATGKVEAFTRKESENEEVSDDDYLKKLQG